jgi:hypothetical protein
MPQPDTWSNAVKELWADQKQWNREHPVYRWFLWLVIVAFVCGELFLHH